MKFSLHSDPLVRQYQKYREAQVKLNSKILDNVSNKDDLEHVINFFGVLEGDTVMMENESEMDVFQDFMIYNIPRDKYPNAALEYAETQHANDREQTVIDAMKRNFFSLFEILKTEPGKRRITLKDVINDDRPTFELIDIGLSQSAPVGALFAIRILLFAEFNMTSGAYVGSFAPDQKVYLLRQYKKQRKKYIDIGDPVARDIFIWFHLNRTTGRPTETRNI